MTYYPISDKLYFQHAEHRPDSSHRPFQVKTEDTASPNLGNLPSASLHHFQFQFTSHPQHLCTTSHPKSSSPVITSAPPVYRFGSHSPTYSTMPSHEWPSSSTSSQHQSSSAGHMTGAQLQNHTLDVPSMQHTMAFNDEYDDADELSELPGAMAGTSGLIATGSGQSGERTIRRRSSKACDQCRKSKCKCERGTNGEACRSCVMLGTPCTFLGPSRKRGPPKGYIDAIEARLHQTEALLGIMIASADPRAQGLLEDLRNDPLAKEIINRVDNSPYGSKGRKKGTDGIGVKTKTSGNSTSGSVSPAQYVPKTKADGDQHPTEFTSTHPSNEWQDSVTKMLRVTATARVDNSLDASDSLLALRFSQSSDPAGKQRSQSPAGERSLPQLVTSIPGSSDANCGSPSSSRRQRRRTDAGEGSGDHSYGFEQALIQSGSPSAVFSHGREYPSRRSLHPLRAVRSMSPLTPRLAEISGVVEARRRSHQDDYDSSGSEDDLTDAVGQLSLNEDEQVRYHGKASGLHLLGVKERVDGRNEGGIWRFPKARVWPPLPSDARIKSGNPILTAPDDEYVGQLPEAAIQKHLLDLYFAYVHPGLPVVHKHAFYEVYQNGDMNADSPASSSSDAPSVGSPFNRRRRRIPTLLLLAMFAIAARYSTHESIPPPADGSMWAAGDLYLDSAKVILDGTYASSRPATCQALLLMGYREIGIGAMAQAWIYIGMAVRMAQDLGMHRSADGWARVGLGGRLFGEWELQERKRIWYTCVIMDKYVSAYIGRPLAIFEWDFDTTLPSEDDAEELETWQPHPSEQSMDDQWESKTPVEPFAPVPARIISCFNYSATLSSLLSGIIQSIYSSRPPSSRHAAKAEYESLLDKWYIELPDHLRYDPSSAKELIPTPNILTLHMQYWCSVLLLHRPFTNHRNVKNANPVNPSSPVDTEDGASAKKSYELCAGAANHLTSIVTAYTDKYCLRRASVFLCYYVFTASIMHVTILATYPTDPQARMGLKKCMDALNRMDITWPSAGRALELLRGSKINVDTNAEVAVASGGSAARNKRAAEQSMDQEDAFERGHLLPPENTPEYLLRPHSFDTHGFPNGPESYTADAPNPHDGAPVSPNLQYYQTFERWPSDNTQHQPGLSYANTLSTSVLPQLYSTGLVDERTVNRGVPGVEVPSQGHTRYPQYWNDYSAFPQLGSTYGNLSNIHDQGQVPQHSPSVPPSHPSNIYLQGDYPLYNNPPTNS